MPMTFEKCYNESPDQHRSKPVPCEFCGLPVCVEELRSVRVDKPEAEEQKIPVGWFRRLARRIFGKKRPGYTNPWDRDLWLRSHRKCKTWLRWTLKRYLPHSWFTKGRVRSHSFRNEWHFMTQEEIKREDSRFYWSSYSGGPWWY